MARFEEGEATQSSLGRMPSPSNQEAEVAWDLLDRCLLPVLFAHAASVILSYITPISSIGLFLLLGSATLAAVLAYHNLKVGLNLTI